MWFDPDLAGLFITSTLLHMGEDINLLVVSRRKCWVAAIGDGGRGWSSERDSGEGLWLWVLLEVGLWALLKAG